MELITLGITGGIGSGKSVLCRMLSALDIPVYDTDERAKALYTTDHQLRQAIIQRFGEGIYTASGGIDRAKLAAIIFSDAEALAAVEALVHPAVRRDIARWKSLMYHQGYQLCALESALLLSSPPLAALTDYTVVVCAPEQVRAQRAAARDGVSLQSIQTRMQRQMTQEQMIERADTVIINDGQTPLLPQLDRLLSDIRYSP